MAAKDLKHIPNYAAFVVRVWFDTEKIFMEMHDGRLIGVSLAWFPRLANATPAQRNNWELIGRGVGVHWPDIDEDLSAESMFSYLPKK